MTLGLFKIVGHELKKTLSMFLLIGLIFISLFATINTLSTLTFSFWNSFLNSYGYSWFGLPSTGLNILDKIDELGKDEYILSLYSATGYTQPEAVEGGSKPYFYKSNIINAFTDVYCFNFVDNSSINIATNKLDEYLGQLNEQGILSNSYEYFSTTLLGEYAVFNSSSLKFISEHFIEYDQNIEDNSIFINNLIAQKNNIQLNENIKMITAGGEVTVKVSGIFDFKNLSRAFICNIKLFDKTVNVPDQYHINIRLTQNANFTTYYNFFNTIFGENQFTYDTDFLKTFNMVKALYAVVVVLLVAFVFIGILAIYEFTKLIIDKRKKFIYHLKLIGSRDTQIILIYVLLFIPLLIFISIGAFLISELFIGIIAAKFIKLFNWTLISQLTYISPVVLALIFAFFFVFLFKSLLSKNKRNITYTLYKETK